MRHYGNIGRGATLAELVMVMALMSMLLLAVHQMASYGIKYYRDSTDSLEVQQQCLLASARLTADLSESRYDTVRVSPDGIVFASPRAEDGSSTFDAQGRLLWQSLVCYYRDPATNVLYRQKENLATPRESPPDPDVLTPARSPAYFAGLPEPRVVGRSITEFTPTLGVDLVELSVVASLSNRYEHLVEVRSKAFPRN